MNRTELLNWEITNLNGWLSCANMSATPVARLGPSPHNTIAIQNFPLPDRFRPDYIDIALIVDEFPTDAPKGLYMLKTSKNKSVIEALAQKFNVFQNQAFHGAPAKDGFEWLCYGYLDGWRYNARMPHAGDNIFKMLKSFSRILEEN